MVKFMGLASGESIAGQNQIWITETIFGSHILYEMILNPIERSIFCKKNSYVPGL